MRLLPAFFEVWLQPYFLLYQNVSIILDFYDLGYILTVCFL